MEQTEAVQQLYTVKIDIVLKSRCIEPERHEEIETDLTLLKHIWKSRAKNGTGHKLGKL